MRDRVEFGLLVIAFAALLTTHVTLTVGLARRIPRWRGVVAFFAPPLAPWWGWQENMRVRGVLWVVGAVCYATVFAFAIR